MQKELTSLFPRMCFAAFFHDLLLARAKPSCACQLIDLLFDFMYMSDWFKFRRSAYNPVERFTNKIWKPAVNCMFVPKRLELWLYSCSNEWTLEIFMHYGLTSGSIHALLHQYSWLIGTLSTQKQLYTVWVGGSIGQGTDATHLRLN